MGFHWADRVKEESLTTEQNFPKSIILKTLFEKRKYILYSFFQTDVIIFKRKNKVSVS